MNLDSLVEAVQKERNLLKREMLWFLVYSTVRIIAYVLLFPSVGWKGIIALYVLEFAHNIEKHRAD